MGEPVWLPREAIILLHEESLAEFGGLPGLRNEEGLESALARPRNCHAYEGIEDSFRLAAEYAFGIMRNHPFLDGNKRGGFLAAGVFLALNGWSIQGDETEVANACLLLAGGEWGVAEFAFWLRENCVAI